MVETTDSGVGSSAQHGRRYVPPEPPRTPKAERTRQKLRLIAGELFIERGYDAVSLRDIADRAGLTKGAIYGHFSSKGSLLVEVIRWKLAEREHAQAFQDQAARPDAAALMIDEAGRNIRLLEVDAAAAARHDAEVALGMAELYSDRNRQIFDVFVDTNHPDVMAFIIAALSAGIGMKEAVGVTTPAEEPWIEVISSMLASADP